MVIDGNCRGALPTLNGLWKCPWRHNRPGGSFYCCLIICIKWHRPSNRLWLYLDVRGESDLRSPGTSGVWFREGGGTNNVVELEDRIITNQNGTVFLTDLMGIPQHVRQYAFFPEDAGAAHRNDRFKGVLEIDANLFSRTGGTYEFCYANAAHRVVCDFETCALFTLEHGQTLIDAFPTFSLESESPFASDTDAVWNERWAPHLIASAANNLNFLGPWPECIGMTGVEAANYIRSQNRDLREVQYYPPGVSMTMDLRPNRVRFWVSSEGLVYKAPKRG
jgi:Potato inhibitor I family